MPPNATASARHGVDEAASMGDDALVAGKPVKGRFTWQEVAKHSSQNDAWVIIDGRVYDVTAFMDRHPGGREMLALAAGRECTELFNSYHWLHPDRPRKMMEKYEIGVLEGPTELPIFAPDTRGFYKTLSDRVRAYFEEKKLDPKDPLPGLWRLALIFAVAFTALGIMCTDTLPVTGTPIPWSARLAAAVVFGIFQAMPLLHAMHDASHTAIGSHEGWWKTIGRLCLDWYAGGMMISWHHQHVVGHHLYTNVFLADPDIPYALSGDPRFLNHSQYYSWVYRFQWLYLPVLYGVLGFRTRVQDIFATWINKDCGPVRINFYDSPFVRVILTKAVWAAWRIALPLYVLNVPSREFWTLFWIAEIMTGYWLAWNFEVSHVADTVLWPEEVSAAEFAGKGAAGAKGGKKGKEAAGGASAPVVEHKERSELNKEQRVVKTCWAEVQVRTSVDYGHNSWLTAFWTGALNYQIEHHLFPGISQYHYPDIAPIVMKTCKEFDVPYQLEPSFWAAWKAHVRLLYKLGQEGKPYKWD